MMISTPQVEETWLYAVVTNHQFYCLPTNFSDFSSIRNAAFPNFLLGKHFNL